MNHPLGLADSLTAQAIKDGLGTSVLGSEIHFLETVTSTNDLAKQLAEKGATEGTVVVAESQSRGRGRLGRSWVSPPGGIWLSILLRPKLAADKSWLLTCLAGVAAAGALARTTGLPIRVKWSNDLLIGNRKVGGVLVESEVADDSLTFAILGIGINANIDLGQLPDDLRQTATSLSHELARPVARVPIIQALLQEMERNYLLLRAGGGDRVGAQIAHAWRQWDAAWGRRVAVTTGQEKIEGIGEGLSPSGAFLLRTKEGETRAVVAGDLEIW